MKTALVTNKPEFKMHHTIVLRWLLPIARLDWQALARNRPRNPHHIAVVSTPFALGGALQPWSTATSAISIARNDRRQMQKHRFLHGAQLVNSASY
jgi:hypothetical protein